MPRRASNVLKQLLLKPWGCAELITPLSQRMTAGIRVDERAYSAGLAAGGGAADEGVAAAAAAAAFFSTMRTARIDPSYSSNSGIASEAWLRTSGGVSTAAMMKASTTK